MVPLTRGLERTRGALVAPIVRRFPAWITPDQLTALRLILAAPLVFFLATGAPTAALAVYLVAILTDALDGELARIRQRTSIFGSRFDPSVDKVLHIAVYLFFRDVSPLLVTTLIALDVMLFFVGLLVVTFHRRVSIAGANVYGKWKLVVQAASILLLLLSPWVSPALLGAPLDTLLLVAIALASLSIVGYLHALFAR